MIRLTSRLALVLLAVCASHAHAARRATVPIVPLIARPATSVDAKMDAPLRRLVDLSVAPGAGAQSDARFVADLAREPVVREGVRPDPLSGQPYASVFVRLDSEGAVSDLIAAGAKIQVQRGDLVLMRIPVPRLLAAAHSPSVRAMSLARRWEASLDSSRIRSGARDVHLGTGLPQAYRGENVIVGVLDSGLDYSHPDFRNTNSDSRLLALYDFSQGEDGAECRAGQLDSLTCPQIDGNGAHGHGTHVTGIAAGNGRLNGAYVGMAPKADLLFVKGIRNFQSAGGFTDADVVNGCAWMLNKALALGKPIAINLSLGGQLGAHDGTSLQEQFLDRFSGPGRIIVCAGGNSGGDPIHVSYPVQGTSYETALETGFMVTSNGGVIDLWAPATTNMNIGLAAYTPSDLEHPVFVSTAAQPGQLLQGTATAQGGQPLANLVIDARTTADPNNGGRNVLIQVTPVEGGVDPASLVWSFYTFGSGTFDAWAAAGSQFMPNTVSAPEYFRYGDDAKTIGIPGTAKRVICVGAHVTKTQWVDIDGNGWTQPNATLDAISGFSSRGPSRDGRVLPNFAAPGEAIISALSVDFPADRKYIIQGGGYHELQGTSQAAPHVAGIAALMLQRDPSLTPENIRTILQQTAAPAGGTVPNNAFGHGRVRALAALQATPDPLQCVTTLPSGAKIACAELSGQPLSMMAYPNPTPASVRVAFLSPVRQRVHLALYDAMGRRVRTLIDDEVAAGTRSSQWAGDDDAGRALPSGLYFAKLTTPSGVRSIRLMLAR